MHAAICVQFVYWKVKLKLAVPYSRPENLFMLGAFMMRANVVAANMKHNALPANSHNCKAILS